MARKGGSYNKGNPSGLSWYKNVAKSLGYTSTELVKTMTPSIGDFFNVNAEATKELVTDLRDLKQRGSQLRNNVNGQSQIAIGKRALKNAIADIKSGKIYNKERLASVYDEDMGSEFGTMNFDFDDPSAEPSDVDVARPSITVRNYQAPISKDSPIVKAMEKHAEAIYKTAQVTNETNVTLATNKLMLDHKANTRIVQGLQTMNDNLALLVNFQNDSMSKYIGASLKYYEENLTMMRESIDELKRSNAMYHNQQQQPKKDFDPTEMAFSAGGGLNIKGYMGLVKRNLKEQIDSNPILSQLGWMAKDTDTLKFMAASPLNFISTKIITSLIPTFLQQSMQNLDKTFANFFPAMFMKLNKVTSGSSNPFLQALGSIFGVNIQEKNFVDLSKYNKGPVPFTGKTEKAITEVIPGYLRKILAAVSGKEDVAFDYESGRFKSVRSMQEEFDNKKKYQATSSYEAIDELKRRSDAIVFENRNERKQFMERIDKFFVELTKQPGLVNPRLRKGKYGETIDELQGVYDFEDPNMLRYFRQLILTLPKHQQVQMFGRNALDAKRKVRQMMTDAENDPSKYNANVLFNDLGFNDNVNVNSKTGKASTRGGLPGLVDRFNYTAVDYLRDIKQTLLQGIRVFVGGRSGPGSSGNSVLARHDSALNAMDLESKKFADNKRHEERDIIDTYSQDDITRLRRRGRKVMSSSFDMTDMSDNDLRSHIQAFDEEGNRERESQKGGFGRFVGKMLRGNAQDRYNNMREGFSSMLQKPAEMIKGVFDKIDNTLYSLVFGKSDDDNDTSFMAKTVSMMKDRFNRLGLWMDEKILSPLKDSLFGKEGIITKLKDSDMFKNMKTRMKSIGDFMFGKADADGKRQGGLFADTANNMADMWSGMKYYFTGKGYTNRAGQVFQDNDNSVFGETKKIFTDFKTTISTYLMGRKGAKGENGEDKERGALGGAFHSLKEGFRNFGIAIFGKRTFGAKDANESFKEMTMKIKERAPKALSWGLIGGGAGLFSGSLGLMGSLFLPGGPIGGAIVGTTLGFLSQSDKFKNWVFGEKDADGNRLGGVISRSTQEFAKKHRIAIMGGAGLGALKGMIGGIGLLPSFFLPGGPIGGAIMGIGASLFLRSEGFQKMMFGEKDQDGKRAGGLIGKMFGKEKKFNNLIGNVGAGTLGGAGIGLVASKLGLMGAMLVPGGPIGGAIMGAAAGIALSSDRWKKALFGDWDEETGLRKGGMLGKFQNWFKLEFQEPLKLQFKEIRLNMKEWFTTSIANPFVDAIAPMKLAFNNMIENMQNFFKNGWDQFKEKIGTVFEQHVGQPFGQFMKTKVMDPLKGFLSKIINGVGRVFGAVLSSPIKALSAIASGMQAKQEQRGLQRHVDDGWDDMKDFKGRRQRGERMGLFRTKDSDGNVVGKGVFGRINDMYFNQDARQAAREGEHGASYASAERDRIAARNEQQTGEFASARASLKAERERLAMHRKLGLKYDYENFDQNGANISRIYNIYQKMSREGIVDGNGRKLADKLGISLDQVLGEGVDTNNLTKQQKKKLSNAIKRGLRGGAAKNLMGTKNFLEDESTEVVEVVGDMSDKMTSTLKEESVKHEVQESNKHLSKIQSLIERIARGLGHSIDPTPTVGGMSSGLRNLMGNRRAIQAPNLKLPTNVSNSKGKPDGSTGGFKAIKVPKFKLPKPDGSHASGIDDVPHDNYQAELHQGEMVIPADQANRIREAFGIGKRPASKVKGAVNPNNMVANGLNGSEKSGGIFGIMATYLRTIAVSVNGQLDGVGKNVFQIRKILQKSNGIEDSDLTGSANKDRVGFWGKIRRAFFRPLDVIREKFMGAVQFVTEKVRVIGTAIANTAKAIVMIPVNIGKALWSFTKHVGDVLKETTMNIVKIPLVASKMLLAGLQGAVEGIRMIGPAIGNVLLGATKVFSGAMQATSHALIGLGRGVGAFVTNLGEGASKVILKFGEMTASLVGSIGKTIAGTVKMVTDMTLKTSGIILDGTFKILTTVSKKLLDIGDSLLQIVTSPIKFLAQGIGKALGRRSEVVIVGGKLDSVDSVGAVENVKKVERVEHVEHVEHVVEVERIKEIVPVYLVPEKVRGSFKSLLPLPVTMHEDSKTMGSMSGFKTMLDSGSKHGRNSMTNSFLKALEVFDAGNDSEEGNRAKLAEDEAEKDAKHAHVSRKTANYQLDILRAREKEEFERDATLRQTSLLERIASSTTEHKNSWMDIFGKKGLLTLGILAALPFLKDILKFLGGLDIPGIVSNLANAAFGLGEKQDESRQDVDENGNPVHIENGEFREDVVKGATKLGAKYGLPVASKALLGASTGVSIAKIATKVGTKIINSKPVKTVTNAIANSKVGQTAANLFKSGTQIVKNKMVAGKLAATITQNTVKEVMDKDAAKILDGIRGLFQKFFDMKEIKNKLGSAAAGALSKIIDLIEKVFTKGTISKYMPRLSAAFLKQAGKVAGSAATLGLVDIGFAAWDVTSGAYEAAQIFRVDSDAVDWKMRTAAGVVKALFGYFPVVNILVDILEEQAGISLKEYVATSVYSLIASNTKVAELEANKNAFKMEWEAYNEANGTDLSLTAYNDKVNTTLAQDIGNTAKKVGNAVSTATNAVGDGISTAFNSTAEFLGLKKPEPKGTSTAVSDALVSGARKGSKYAINTVKAIGSIGTSVKEFNAKKEALIKAGASDEEINKLTAEFWKSVNKDVEGIKDIGQNDTFAAKASKTVRDFAVKSLTSFGKFVTEAQEQKDAIEKGRASADKNIKEINEKTKKTWEGLRKDVDGGWTTTGKTLLDKLKGINSDTDGEWNKIQTETKTKWGTIGSIISTVLDKTKTDTDNAWGNILKPINETWKHVSDTVSEKMKPVAEGLKKIFDPVTDVFSGLFGGGDGGKKETPQKTGFISGFIDKFTGGPLYANTSAQTMIGDNKTPLETSQKVFQGYRITSQFGVRKDPFNGTAKAHTGIDLVKPHGSPITSFTEGTVVHVGRHDGNDGSGYGSMGNVVAVKDKMGYTHVYAHLNGINVSKGQKITPGQMVGTQGSTGRSTGSHLHYEIRKGGLGTAVDPTLYLMQTKNGTSGASSGTATLSTSTAEGAEELTILDLFGKMSENFSLYASNVYGGTSEEFKLYGDPTTLNADGSSSLTGLNSFTPMNIKNFSPSMQEAIANKTAAMIVQGEGGNPASVIKDYEPGTRAPRGMSIGLMQWNRGRAHSLMQRLAKSIPGAGFEQFANDASIWGSSWWPESRIDRLKTLLQTNRSKVEQVQRAQMADDIMSKNLSPIFNSGKLRDPRSIVMLADIGNTGPAHIGRFLQSYSSPASGSPEFPHFFNQLKAKSYWGSHWNTYGNRLNNAYSALQSWMPSDGKTAPGGQGGPSVPILAEKLMQTQTPSGSGNRDLFADRELQNLPMEFTSSYQSVRPQQVVVNGGNGDLSQLIGVLQEIAANTGATNVGLDRLNSKDMTFNLQSDTPNNMIVVNSAQGGSSSNPIVVAANSGQNKKSQTDYNSAKRIAAGRNK